MADSTLKQCVILATVSFLAFLHFGCGKDDSTIPVESARSSARSTAAANGETEAAQASPERPRAAADHAASGAADGVAQMPLSGKVHNAEVVQLIDQLVDVSTEGTGFHSTAWSLQFMALDGPPHFVGGVLGSPKPTVPAPMRELVVRGLSALPDLIQHLSDSRETKLSVGGGIIMNLWHSDEYHPRYRDPALEPPGVDTDPDFVDMRSVGDYTITVGDLCYVAVGQIVNRHLDAVRYQPTGNLVINSPVESPALAAATRKDWWGISSEEHEKSLTQDAMDRYPDAAAAALQRLLFYYPQTGEEVALRLLGRPFYDSAIMWDFVMEDLVKERNATKWQALIDGFGEDNGRAAQDILPCWLHWIYWQTSIVRDDAFYDGRAAAERILAELYPLYSPYRPAFVNAASLSEQREVVEGLHSFESEKLDAAVHEVFLRAIRFGFPQSRDDGTRIAMDDLSAACMERMIGKGNDGIYLAYLARRIKKVEGSPANSPERYRLEGMREWKHRFERRAR